MRAIVIGSGVAGPVTATALRRVGIDTSLYEAHPGPGIALGAHLGIAPNGLAVLRTLDLLDRVRNAPGTVPSSRTEFRSGWGRLLGLLDDGSRTLSTDDLESLSLRRGELQATLATAAVEQGVSITYGKRLTRHTDTGSSVIAEFTDGSTEEADVLIGADGIHSAVRCGMDPLAPEPTYIGLLALGGWATSADVVPTPLSTGRLVWARRAFFGYQTAPDGTVYWFVNIPHPELSKNDIASRGTEWWRRHTQTLFAGQMPDITTILAASDERWFLPYPIHTVSALDHWARGRVALVGDAAHALPNSSGQGASMAIEDAMTLAMCLRDITEPSAALEHYERLRRPRVERIVAEGTHRGDLKQITNPAGVFLRNHVLLPHVCRKISRTGGHSWIFDHRVDFDAPVRSTGSAH